jgi:hypothetical protein
MSFYDINYGLQWQNLLPPSKRSQEFIDWGKSLLAPLQWLVDLFFGSYFLGDSTTAAYDPAVSYIKGERVRYLNSLYEVINTPSGAGVLPTDIDYWILVQQDWRGVQERILYDGQKLNLEYMLNRWFGTTFNQPSVGNSEIYITNLITNDDLFFIGENDDDTGDVAATDLFQSDFIGASYTFQPYNFRVNYPLSLIPSTSDPLYAQLVALTNRYKLYATTPTWVGY